MNANAVFVYGTLRRGGSNHFRMAGSDFFGSGRIHGRIYRVDWYPVLIRGGDFYVKGELYFVSDENLAALDEFEGIPLDGEIPREYRRVRTSVTFATGETREAWVWEWIGGLTNAQPLEGEDWLAFEPNPS